VLITSLGHACLLVDAAGTRVLFDPGVFSPDLSAATDLDAIVVTHEHADHLDRDRLPDLLRANPGAHLWAEPSVAASLAEHDADPLNPGDLVALGSVTLRAVGGDHAVIHRDIPRVGNVGVLLSSDGEPTLLHPGDSYQPTPAGVDVLAVPLSAPWASLRETVDFVRAVAPRVVVPVHDALLSPVGRRLYLSQLERLGGEPVRDLDGAGAVGFDAA